VAPFFSRGKIDPNMAFRLDKSSFSQLGLKTKARLTRVGVFEYRGVDGSISRELRPAEEVFSEDSLASFELVPLTVDHPPEPVTASNAGRYAVGSVGAPKQDGQFVTASVMVLNQDALKQISEGKIQLSCGYTVDHDETPGVWEGLSYDRVQRNIRGNHVAIVAEGRAGPEVKLLLDSKGETPMSVEIEDAVEAAPVAEVATEVEVEAAPVAEVVAEVEAAPVAEVAAEVNPMAEVVAKLQAELDALRLSFPTAVASRVALEKKATELVGDSAWGTMSDLDIKKAVVAKMRPGFKLDGKTEAHVDAAFEIVSEMIPPTASPFTAPAVQAPNDLESIKARYVAQFFGKKEGK